MQTIEERSDGRWRPSPGSVYPTLSQLEDEGLIRATEIDGQKVFEITDAGRARVAEREDAPAPWEDGDERRRGLPPADSIAARGGRGRGGAGRASRAMPSKSSARESCSATPAGASTGSWPRTAMS